jgi:hypothetical protein
VHIAHVSLAMPPHWHASGAQHAHVSKLSSSKHVQPVDVTVTGISQFAPVWVDGQVHKYEPAWSEQVPVPQSAAAHSLTSVSHEAPV